MKSSKTSMWPGVVIVLSLVCALSLSLYFFRLGSRPIASGVLVLYAAGTTIYTLYVKIGEPRSR